MDALLAFSWAHQARSSSSASSHTLHSQSLTQYARILTAFQTLLTTEQADVEIATTIAVLLIATSVTSGGTLDWHCHAGGAVKLLNGSRASFNARLNVYHRFLTRSLIYFDVLRSVVMGREPSLDPVFFEEERDCIVSHNLHSMLGANGHLFAILADICCLGAKTSEDQESGIPIVMEELYQAEDDLERRLVDAQPSESHPLLVSFLFEAYRNAALLFLYQVLAHADPEALCMTPLRTRFSTRLQHLMFYLTRIPTCSAPASALVFPLFIAGVASADEHHRNLVSHKLSDLYENVRFGNISDTIQVLERIWAAPNIRTETLDWQRFLCLEGTFVALF